MSPHCQGGGVPYIVVDQISDFQLPIQALYIVLCTSEAKEQVIFAQKIVSIMSNFSFRENSIAPEPEIS